MDYTAKKAALFIAHPGHVLRAYHWLEIAKPLVFVMTDGSGPNRLSSLPCTTVVIKNVEGSQGAIYGRWTDAGVYEAILNKETDQFVAATLEMADVLTGQGIDYIVGDASEGYNCTHELCRCILNSAVALVEKKTGRRIPNYEILLCGAPDACPENLREKAIRIDLDKAAFERKIAAAESYNPDFKHEVTQQLEQFGEKPFLVEYLLPTGMDGEWSPDKGTPYYETHGEAQTSRGVYKDVIRYDTHFRPLVKELRARLGLV